MSLYRIWIEFSPNNLLSAQPRGGLTTTIQCLLIAAVLCIPQVEAVVGVPAVYSASLIMSYAGWVAVSERWLVPRARAQKWAFDLLNAGDVFLGIAIVVALPIASGDPASILWVFAVMFAGMNGADYDYGPSLIIMLAHCLTPLVGVPFYVASGSTMAAALGAPVFIATLCAIAYHYNAVRRTDVRLALAERDSLRKKLAEEQASRERERIARDLHDSVGASLSTAALYADMLARGAEPEAIRTISEALAVATRDGLTELRGLLDVLSPDDLEGEVFGEGLRAHAERVALSREIAVEVEIEAEPALMLSSAVRFCMARVFQEALSNAIRHSGATSIQARLKMTADTLRLDLIDNGCGFDPRAEASGRGVKGMRARVEEFGGRFEIGLHGGQGTRIVAEIPSVMTQTGGSCSAQTA